MQYTNQENKLYSYDNKDIGISEYADNKLTS